MMRFFNTSTVNEPEPVRGDLPSLDDIRTHNKLLVDTDRVNLHGYFTAFHSAFAAAFTKMDVAFVAKFLDLPDEFCVPYTDLYMYGVFPRKIPNSRGRTVAKWLVHVHGYVPDVHFILVDDSVFMTPDAFKMIMVHYKSSRDRYMLLRHG